MATLSNCIRKAGKSLRKVDADIIRETQQEYVADGIKASEAAVKAIDDYLSMLQEDRTGILERARSAGADISAFTGGPERLSRRGEIEQPRRVKGGASAGLYIGSPGLRTPQELGGFRRRMADLARQGELGRFWYEESSDAILAVAGGDRAIAEKLAGILAIYSPDTAVAPNLTNALKAWNQFQATGQVRGAGRYSRQDIAAQAWLENNELPRGEKVLNFFNNLMRNIYNDPDFGRNEQGVTADVWMARAFGYIVDTPGAAQYRFIENEVNRIARDFGWEPQQVQAAIWIAVKTRMEKTRKEAKQNAYDQGWIVKEPAMDEHGKPKKDSRGREILKDVVVNAEAYREDIYRRAMEADLLREELQASAMNFADAMANHMAQISWEARPSTSVDLIPEIHSAPIEQQIELQHDVSRAFTDDNGVNLLARQIGLLVRGSVDGPGAWDLMISHSAQEGVLIPPKHKPRAGEFAVDVEGHTLANIFSEIVGLLTWQDGVAWHRPFYASTKKAANGVEVELGRPMTHAEAHRVYNRMAELARDMGLTEEDARGFAPIAIEDGFRVLNFTEFSDGPVLENYKPKKSDPDFHKLVKQAAEESFEQDFNYYTFASDGDLRNNDWKENPNGEGYRQRIIEAGFGETLRWAESTLAPRIRAVYADHASRNGWTLPETFRLSLRQKHPRSVQEPGLHGRDRAVVSPPVRDDGRVELTHYSHRDNLTELNPTYYGTAHAGDESARQERYPELWVDRTYYGINADVGGYTKEIMLGNQVYTASIAPEELYDWDSDPDNLKPNLPPGKFVQTDYGQIYVPPGDINRAVTQYERSIRDAGYSGFWVQHESLGMVAAVYKTLPVEGRSEFVDPSDSPSVRFSLNRDKLNRINRDPGDPKSVIDKLGIAVEEQLDRPRNKKTTIERMKAWAEKAADVTRSRRAVLASTPLIGLPDFVRGMSTPEQYNTMTRHMDGYETMLTAGYQESIDPWLDLRRTNREASREMESLMHFTTLWGLDPSKPYEPELTPRQQQMYERLQQDASAGKMTAAKRKTLRQLQDLKNREGLRKERWKIITESWNDLPQEAKDIYKTVLAENNKKYDQLHEALKTRIEEIIPEGRARKAILARMQLMMESQRVRGPYFPISRFGKFYGLVRNTETGEVISFSKFEERADSKDWSDLMREEFKGANNIEVRIGEDSETFQEPGEVDPRFAAQVIEKIKESSIGSSAESEALMRDIWQLYLKSLPEQSARKHGIYRKGVAGFSGDALRSYAHHSFHTAKQISRVTWGHRLDGLLAEMYREAKVNSDPWAIPLYDEYANRHKVNMAPNVHPLAAKLTSAGAHLWLGFLNPGSAVVNTTQNLLFGIPILSADHTVMGEDVDTERAASGAVMQASKQMALGMERGKKHLSSDELKMVDELEVRGVFEKTRAYDLTGMAEIGEDYISNWRRFGEISMKLFHVTEQFNRHVSALAGYRLARDRGNSHEEAVTYAEKVTELIHYNYSNKFRPRIAQGDAARVLLLFRNYSINAQARIWRDMLDSFDALGSKQDPQVKRIARHRLGKLMISSLLFSGLQGLPVWSAIGLAAWLMADDDETSDPKVHTRHALAEMFGDTTAHWIMDGTIDYTTGAQISSRVSLSNLWFMEPTQRDDMVPLTGEWLGYYAGELAGPWGGYARDSLYALQLFKEGKLDRGLEKLAPRSIANAMKTVRYANEGVETATGRVILEQDDLDELDYAYQGLGFLPTKIGLRYQRNSAMKFAQAMRTNREAELRSRMFSALDSGDTDRQKAIDADILAFREENPTTTLTPLSVRQSWRRGEISGARDYLDGVRLTPRERALWKDKFRGFPDLTDEE